MRFDRRRLLKLGTGMITGAVTVSGNANPQEDKPKERIATPKKGEAMKLIVTIKEIKGRCGVYKEGDCFALINGYQLVSDIPVCMHGLGSIMPFYNALGISEPSRWGLAGKEDKSKAYIQCPDACEYTGGGCVTFEISKIE